MVNRKLTSEQILELSNLYDSGESSYVLAKKFNVYPSTILRILKKQHIKARSLSEAANLAIETGRMRKHKIPINLIFDENLSYILGVLCGDGYLDYSNKRMTWQVGLDSIDKEFNFEFSKKLHNFFGIYTKTNLRKKRKITWNRQYVTKLCSKEACDFILNISDFKVSDWKIPEQIILGGADLKLAFLKGFFDSEGEIDKKNGRVGAISINFFGLRDIKNILQNFSIRSTIIKRKDSRLNSRQKYVLRIHDKKSIFLFYELIGFTIVRKQRILKDFLIRKGMIIGKK